jgi:hypothetical protein
MTWRRRDSRAPEGATITHHVDRLEKAGLVRRVLDLTTGASAGWTHSLGVELHARMMTAVSQPRMIVAGCARTTGKWLAAST